MLRISLTEAHDGYTMYYNRREDVEMLLLSALIAVVVLQETLPCLM
jgi:hypothetical protein